MKTIAMMALLGLLVGAGPALSGSQCPDGCSDGDGVPDDADNCLNKFNAAQDDTDHDYCGNLCDADYNQDGRVGIGDFGKCLAPFFGLPNSELCQHVEPISPNSVVNVADFGYFSSAFGGIPGPSGTTPGTVPCPTW